MREIEASLEPGEVVFHYMRPDLPWVGWLVVPVYLLYAAVAVPGLWLAGAYHWTLHRPCVPSACAISPLGDCESAVLLASFVTVGVAIVALEVYRIAACRARLYVLTDRRVLLARGVFERQVVTVDGITPRTTADVAWRAIRLSGTRARAIVDLYDLSPVQLEPFRRSLARAAKRAPPGPPSMPVGADSVCDGAARA